MSRAQLAVSLVAALITISALVVYRATQKPAPSIAIINPPPRLTGTRQPLLTTGSMNLPGGAVVGAGVSRRGAETKGVMPNEHGDVRPSNRLRNDTATKPDVTLAAGLKSGSAADTIRQHMPAYEEPSWTDTTKSSAAPIVRTQPSGTTKKDALPKSSSGTASRLSIAGVSESDPRSAALTASSLSPDDCLTSDRKPDPSIAPSAADHSPLAEQYRAWVAAQAEARASIVGAQRWLKLIEASPKYSSEVKAVYRAQLQCGGQIYRLWLSDIAAFKDPGISPLETMCNYGYDSPLWMKHWPVAGDPPDVSSGPVSNAECLHCTFGVAGAPKPVLVGVMVAYNQETPKVWAVPPMNRDCTHCVIATYVPCVRMTVQPHIVKWLYTIEPGRVEVGPRSTQ